MNHTLSRYKVPHSEDKELATNRPTKPTYIMFNKVQKAIKTTNSSAEAFKVILPLFDEQEQANLRCIASIQGTAEAVNYASRISE